MSAACTVVLVTCGLKGPSSVFEVVMRLLLAPSKKKFFHHPLNIIDMVSVVPIYITLLFDLTVGSESELGDLGRLIQVPSCSLLDAAVTTRMAQSQFPCLGPCPLSGSGPSEQTYNRPCFMLHCLRFIEPPPSKETGHPMGPGGIGTGPMSGS